MVRETTILWFDNTQEECHFSNSVGRKGGKQIIPSEARSLLGLKSHSVASGHKSHVKSCGLPQGEHARLTNSTVQLDCAHRV